MTEAKCLCQIILPRRVQHIFNKDPVAGIRGIYQNVGDGADEFAVLNDGTTGHE